jgi:hypothetical protein
MHMLGLIFPSAARLALLHSDLHLLATPEPLLHVERKVNEPSMPRARSRRPKYHVCTIALTKDCKDSEGMAMSYLISWPLRDMIDNDSRTKTAGQRQQDKDSRTKTAEHRGNSTPDV